MAPAGAPAQPTTFVARALPWLVLAVVSAAFLPSLGGGYFWDDQTLVAENPAMGGGEPLRRTLTGSFFATAPRHESPGTGYYRPVVIAADALLFQAGGGRPFPFHLVNLLLHLACVALFARFLIRRLDGPGARAAAWAAAGLFALFPARPESVTWISGSTDLWMALFVLLGMEAFDVLKGAWRGALASLAFVLAFFSKETAIVAPLLLALDGWLLGRPGWPRRLWTLLPMGAALAVRGAFVAPPPGPLALGLADLVLRVLSTLGQYAVHTLWPWTPSIQLGLHFPDGQGTYAYPAWSVAAGAACLLAAAGVAGLAFKRTPARPWAADAAWLALPLLPVLNLFSTQMPNLIAERNLYLPHLGLFALLARAAAPQVAARPRQTGLLALALALPLLLATVPHVQRLSDGAEAWDYELRLNPDNPLLLEANAAFRLSRQEYALAAQAALRAYRISPRESAVPLLLEAIAGAEADAAARAALVRFLEGLGSPGGPASFDYRGLAIGARATPAQRLGWSRHERVRHALALARGGAATSPEELVAPGPHP